MKRRKGNRRPTEREVAEFMKKRLEEEEYLNQEVIVHEIEEKFGGKFVYSNESGNRAISPSVLAAFRRVTPNVVWVRSERHWRRRENSDKPGSRMQE